MRILLLALGPLIIAVSFGLMLLRVEPFANFFYLFAWYGLILTFDQLVRRRQGYSPVARCGAPFLLVLLWSAATWYFFEIINLRLQNWHYVFVIDHALARFLGTFFSFATVLPGILLIQHYLALLGLGTDWRARPLVLRPAGLRRMQAVGLLFLLLPLLFPAYCFPLIWLAVFLLLAPLVCRTGAHGLLDQVKEGQYGPFGRTLAAGLVAGFLWEFLNFWARAKWIYTVPFFDRIKLFEMPLAGFLGFAPFAVECVVLYRLLVWYRLAPPFGLVVTQRPEPRSVRSRLPVWLALVVFCVAVDQLAVSRYVIASVTPRVRLAAGLSERARAALEATNVEYLTELEGLGAESLWQKLATRLSPEQLARTRRTTALYLHEGIGTEFGNLLVEAGVASLEELAAQSPADLHARLIELQHEGRVPTLRQVRVWVRRAR